MLQLCHRCGGDLPLGGETTVFCPHCAAPQLLLSEACLAGDPAADTTGSQPPPAPRQVDWQAAIRCAALTGAIAALLNVLGLRVPGLSFAGTLWVLTTSMTTLALYRYRRPLAWMDAGIGARIGLTAALSSIAFVAAALALAGLVARFGLHSLAGFDLALSQMLAQVKLTAAASANPAPPELLHLYDVPEFQAGLVLASAAMTALFLLVFSAAGGAVGGLLGTRKPVAS